MALTVTPIPALTWTLIPGPRLPPRGRFPSTAIPQWAAKNPGERVWRWLDATAWVAGMGTTITYVASGFPESDGALSAPAVEWSGTVIGVLLAGGTAGSTYTVRLRPILADGRQQPVWDVTLPISVSPAIVAPPDGAITLGGVSVAIGGVPWVQSGSVTSGGSS